MSNDLTTPTSTALSFGAIPDRDALSAFVTGLAANAVVSTGGKQYLKISDKDGGWYYGTDALEVEPDALWVINPLSLWHNYIAWFDGAVEAETPRQPMNTILPHKGNLPVVKAPNGWQLQQGLDIVCVSGEDTGLLCEYKASSVGGTRCIGDLASALQRQFSMNPDKLAPIVQLRNRPYEDKKYKKTQYPPVFQVVDWRSLTDGAPVSIAPVSAPVAVAAPAPAPEPAPEAAPAGAVPRRRART